MNGKADATGPNRATFGDAVRSEWVKLRTLPSAVYTALVAAVVGVGLSSLFYFTAARGYAGLSPADQAAFDPTAKGGAGIIIAQMAIGLLGVLVVTSEYASGMIKASMTVVPCRDRLLAAKAAVLLAVVLVVGEVIAFGSFLAGQGVLAAVDAPHASLADSGVARAVVGAGLDLAAVGLLGLALGVLFRATAGALAVIVVVTLIVPAFVTVLPESAAKLIGTYWPTLAGRQVMTVHPDPHALGPWPGFAVMCAWVAAALVAAFVDFRRREV